MNHKRRLPGRSENGFTLIELLVVIAIIALLMGILMPALQKVKEKAQDTVCKTNLSNIGLGITMYLQDNDFYLADAGRTNSFFWYNDDGTFRDIPTGRGPNTWGSQQDGYWGLLYINYIKGTKVFGCPSFKKTAELIYPIDPALIRETAYCINYQEDFRGKKTTSIRRQYETILSHDHVEPRVEQDEVDMFHNNDTPGAMNLTHYRQGGARSKFYRGIFRHNVKNNDPFSTGGTANILWLDGHVSPLEETTGDNVPKRWYSGE
jgi:prepilin-type N-terminal cleavage/methylation domain-containing protein/prepilin-type processing-associated H-X9-DG protein